jgi:hypothetical protein
MTRTMLFRFRGIFVQKLAVGVAARDSALFGGKFEGFFAIEFCLVH